MEIVPELQGHVSRKTDLISAKRGRTKGQDNLDQVCVIPCTMPTLADESSYMPYSGMRMACNRPVERRRKGCGHRGMEKGAGERFGGP